MKFVFTLLLLFIGLLAYSQDLKFNVDSIKLDKQQPLYVVDGVKIPLSQPPGAKQKWAEVLDLYTDRFESITILNGKEATDKYGVEGINGVVLITTKPLPKNEPLYIVDGVVVRDVSLVNPNNIQSIHVLKDKSETSKYIMGENGVVLISTKNRK